MTVISSTWGRRVGEVEPDGTVRNSLHQIVGRVSTNGEVTDAWGKVVGYTDVGGSIYDRSKRRIGQLTVSEIRDSHDRIVGTCDDPFAPWSQTAGAGLLLLLR